MSELTRSRLTELVAPILAEVGVAVGDAHKVIVTTRGIEVTYYKRNAEGRFYVDMDLEPRDLAMGVVKVERDMAND